MKENLTKLKILIAPLDWGLGHTTRCIPLIKALQKFNADIWIAGNETQKKILQQEFPGISFLPLKGYCIKYSYTKRFLLWKILFQIPKILSTIQFEKKWLKKAIALHSFNLIISDNRFGFYNKKIPCIFITHQLQIQAPRAWQRSLIQQINYKYINRFTTCWVPDLGNEKNIAGKLSHPKILPSVPISYMGILSRFAPSSFAEIKYKWLFILSGPEPQRTILENKFLAVIPSLPGKCLFIRGLPLQTSTISVSPNCTVFNHLSSLQLQKAFEQSEFVISRSGYTTAMELLSLQKKSILIPTPGQTEQEYLAQHLMNEKWCYATEQNSDLLQAINQAEFFAFNFFDLNTNALHQTISTFISKYF